MFFITNLLFESIVFREETSASIPKVHICINEKKEEPKGFNKKNKSQNNSFYLPKKVLRQQFLLYIS